MQRTRRVLVGLVVVLVLLLIATRWLMPRLDAYKVDGELSWAALDGPVEIVRDENGMATVRAESLADMIRVQGFVTAQDRLFQMHLARLASQGRLSELAGDAALPIDTYRRTLGFHRLARAHAAILDEETRAFFEHYVAGVNRVIERQDELPMAFGLAGMEPEVWTIEDSLSILYYMAWGSSANLRHELVAQLLIEAVGAERARELAPININPDHPPLDDDDVDDPAEQLDAAASFRATGLESTLARLLSGPLAADDAPRLGSNNWVAGPTRSPSDKPIVVNDPHLDPRMIPGVWHPIGLRRPGRAAVGVAVPGIPGITIGRTGRVAVGVTNAYADTQDLFVETVDPADSARYLDAGESVPFGVIEETIRVRDDEAPGGFRDHAVTIRTTRRGPVITDSLPGQRPQATLSLRWAAAAAITPERGARLGFVDLLEAQSVADLDAALESLPMISLNFVFADIDGAIGWRVSGLLPDRVEGAGTAPWPVQTIEEANGADSETASQDPWIGWVPFAEMPHAFGSERDWLGTANHYVARHDADYYYSSLASPSYRYRRLIELFDATPKPTVDDHWAWQLDARNLLAESIAPIFAEALSAHDATSDLGEILAAWDHVDAADAAAPLVFQETMRQLALATFRDELGETVALAMLDNWYYWQERFERMVLAGQSTWFDDVSTAEVETLAELIRRAGEAARARLAPEVGPDPRAWRWGDLHHLTFSEAIRRDGSGSRWLGSGPHPAPGSGETLHRGWYDFPEPFGVTHTASLRMVVDLGDPDKVRAVLPGGVAGRLFHPHRTDQIDDFVDGSVLHWWFSDQAIDDHAEHRLLLTPESTSAD